MVRFIIVISRTIFLFRISGSSRGIIFALAVSVFEGRKFPGIATYPKRPQLRFFAPRRTLSDLYVQPFDRRRRKTLELLVDGSTSPESLQDHNYRKRGHFCPLVLSS